MSITPLSAGMGALGRATAAAFTPAALPGLVYWLSAGAITGVSDGVRVDTLPDASGNGHPATCTAGQGGTYVAAAAQLGGKPAIQMNEYAAGFINNYQLAGMSALFPAHGTVFSVMYNLAGDAQWGGWGTDTALDWWQSFGGTMYPGPWRVSRIETTYSNASLITAGPQVFAYTSTTGAYGNYYNRNLIYTTGAHTHTNTDVHGFSWVTRADKQFTGLVSDVIVTSTDLSGTAALTQLHDWAATRYSLNI